MVALKNKSICDTDMLINLQLGNVFSKFKENEEFIFIADSVMDELSFICDNLDSYKYLYNDISDSSDLSIKIIYAKDFSITEQRMINAMLQQYKISTHIGTDEIEKNKGEFVTTLYAIYKNIGIVRTCDKEFIKKHSQDCNFNEISFRHLNETLSDFLSNKDRINANKLIEQENKVFNKSKENSRKRNITSLIDRFNNLKPS